MIYVPPNNQRSPRFSELQMYTVCTSNAMSDFEKVRELEQERNERFEQRMEELQEMSKNKVALGNQISGISKGKSGKK